MLATQAKPLTDGTPVHDETLTETLHGTNSWISVGLTCAVLMQFCSAIWCVVTQHTALAITLSITTVLVTFINAIIIDRLWRSEVAKVDQIRASMTPPRIQHTERAKKKKQRAKAKGKAIQRRSARSRTTPTVATVKAAQ